MKNNILLSLAFLCALFLNAQDNWINFEAYPTDLNLNLEEVSDFMDAPFEIKNKSKQTKSYLLPVKFTAIAAENISDLDVKITGVNASYDTKGRLIIYFRGKVDMSCCYQASIALEFYDTEDNLIQTAKTDDLGNFKIKSINGNMIDIKGGKLKFNFSKLKSFDADAVTRYSKIELYEKPIDNQFKTLQEKTLVNSKN